MQQAVHLLWLPWALRTREILIENCWCNQTVKVTGPVLLTLPYLSFEIRLVLLHCSQPRLLPHLSSSGPHSFLEADGPDNPRALRCGSGLARTIPASSVAERGGGARPPALLLLSDEASCDWKLGSDTERSFASITTTTNANTTLPRFLPEKYQVTTHHQLEPHSSKFTTLHTLQATRLSSLQHRLPYGEGIPIDNPYESATHLQHVQPQGATHPQGVG